MPEGKLCQHFFFQLQVSFISFNHCGKKDAHNILILKEKFDILENSVTDFSTYD